MPERKDLERRVEELERELGELKRRRPKGVRYRSAISLGNIPLLAVAAGPDLERGELRGHAKGIVAVGDMATGS